MKTDKKNSVFDKIKSGKALELIVIAIIVLIAIYNAFGKKNEKAEISTDYCSAMEERLVSVLSKLDGAGDVRVMITFADEGEKILAYETVEKADGSIVTTPILVNGNVVVLSEKSPEISGVLIVATGADSIVVRFNLIDAAASVLNINKSIIKVYES